MGGGIQGGERVCARGGCVLICGGTDAVLWGGWPPIEIKKYKLKKKKSYGKFSTLFNVSNKDALFFFLEHLIFIFPLVFKILTHIIY